MRWRRGEPVYAILTEERNTEKVCAGKQRESVRFPRHSRHPDGLRKGRPSLAILADECGLGWEVGKECVVFLKATSRYFVASRRMLKVLSRQTSSA